MRKRMLVILSAMLILGTTIANGYFLQMTYTKYNKTHMAAATIDKSLIKVTPTTNIISAKQQTLSPGRTGSSAGVGTYKFEELNHSKLYDKANLGDLTLATEKASNANFLLAGDTSAVLTPQTVSPNWSLGVVNQDTIWQPASCASKPTYLIGGRYIFIDDGKENAADKYPSYLVFDMVSQKYRYFGGNSFTQQQGDKEHILSIQNENGSLVFYIDQSDSTGPLASSSTFKHARANAPGYITRRIINASALTYTDYKLPYTVPNGIQYFYIDAGTDFGAGQVATLTPDTVESGGTYYPGVATNNALTFTPTAITATPAYAMAQTIDPTLDQSLTAALPSFTTNFNAQSANAPNRFTVANQGALKNLQFLIASQSWTSDGELFDSPVVYNSTTQTVDAMMLKPVISSYVGGNYVALGVF
jgi:hypothetical protein